MKHTIRAVVAGGAIAAALAGAGTAHADDSDFRAVVEDTMPAFGSGMTNADARSFGHNVCSTLQYRTPAAVAAMFYGDGSLGSYADMQRMVTSAIKNYCASLG
jgi:hypothetical protein